MEEKINFNELVNLCKDDMIKYNEYMDYLKSVLKNTIKNIREINIAKIQNYIVMVIEYIYDNKICFLETKREIKNNKKSIYNNDKYNFGDPYFNIHCNIFSDIERFIEDNEFMNGHKIIEKYRDGECIIDILPSMISLYYKKDSEKLLSLSYRNSHSKKYNNEDQKIIDSLNTYSLHVKENILDFEINELLNAKIIDKDELPSYICEKNKQLKKIK